MTTTSHGLGRASADRARDDGVTMIEYALLAAMIAVALIATILLVGTALQGAYTSVADAFG